MFTIKIIFLRLINVRETIYTLKPHFYKTKLGTGVCKGFPIFLKLFLLQNIDCGYLLEPSRRGSSNVHPQSMF